MRWELHVRAGSYSEPTLLRLLWAVLKHRCEHLLAGDGWRD